ncbi:MAG: DMT family transporter [Chthonomonadales bacterium]
MSQRPAHREPSPALAYWMLAVGQLAIGSAALLARFGLDAGAHPVVLAAWRLTLAAIMVLAGCALAAMSRTRARSAQVPALRLAAAGVLLGLHFAAWFASLQRTPVALSTLLVCTTPVWTGLGGRLFLGERVRPWFWAGLAIAAAGMRLITLGSASAPLPIPNQQTAGAALAVAGAMLIAAYLLIIQKLTVLPQGEALGTWQLVAWTYSFGALSLWPFALAAAPPSRVFATPVAVWLSALGMAVVPQIIGHTVINWSVRRLPAPQVAATILTEPVFAAALAWAFLGERVRLHQGIGGVILLAGVALAMRGAPPAIPEEPL